MLIVNIIFQLLDMSVRCLKNETPSGIPTVITGSVSNIGTTSADVQGEITNLGGSEITHYGHCWSVNPDPTINNNSIDFGSSSTTLSYISELIPLTTGTTYYVKAYATNSYGTAYGEEVSFTTGQNITTPVVTTAAITNITQSSATSGGNVIEDGGANVTARGVCYGTSQNPTISGNHTTNGSGTGSFNSNITGLSSNTTYYVRAYATNSVGTSYGNELSFTTGQNITTPVVTTTNVTNITQNSAVSGGNVTSSGGASVTARGVCWSTSQNPSISGNHTTNGSGTGSFISNITGLSPNTTYYVRAYATNSAGTSYGNELSFTTEQNITTPIVTTTNVTNITQNSAVSGGNVTSSGGANVTARGVCWSTNQNPTINDDYTVDGSGTGSFTSNLTGLNENTNYYVRAYATNSVGTAYGNQLSFTTLDQAPVLTGPSVATGPFEITWTYDWPTLQANDDHYELEHSFNPNSGFEIIAVYPDGDRTSPFTETINTYAGAIGLTSYFRVRAKVLGYYTPYSNVLSVQVPYLNFDIHPMFDNSVAYATVNPNWANTVYNSIDLGVGTFYYTPGTFNDYETYISALYFDIDPYIEGMTIQSAVLKLQVDLFPVDYSTMYRINPFVDSWNTNTLTFNNMPNFYTSPSVLENLPYYNIWEVDITSIVQAWANGSIPNFGIAIYDNNIIHPGYPAIRNTWFYSNETAGGPEWQPKLHLEIQ